MTNRIPVIGVMGGANVPQNVYDEAFELGALIAENSWLLLNGGRDCGVMQASAKGAKTRGGTTIGVLPGNDKNQANPFIDIPIITNMGDARNVINILSSDVVVACYGGTGTISEIALALKNEKPLILLNSHENIYQSHKNTKTMFKVQSPQECIELIKTLL